MPGARARRHGAGGRASPRPREGRARRSPGREGGAPRRAPRARSPPPSHACGSRAGRPPPGRTRARGGPSPASPASRGAPAPSAAEPAGLAVAPACPPTQLPGEGWGANSAGRVLGPGALLHHVGGAQTRELVVAQQERPDVLRQTQAHASVGRMSTSAGLHRYTYADYLALEAASNVKHEFLAGEIYGMAGGTPEHAALSVAVSSALLAQLRGGPCRVYSSDLRVRVLAT